VKGTMKTGTKNLFLLPLLIAALGLTQAGRATAQTFTTLNSFTATSGPYPSTITDGDLPIAGLVVLGNTLYGTATYGGSSDNGTVFKVNTDGAGFTNLHSFTGDSGYPAYTNNDGAYPYASLILSSNILYGTASSGGGSRGGTLFSLNTDGTGFTNLHNF